MCIILAKWLILVVFRFFWETISRLSLTKDSYVFHDFHFIFKNKDYLAWMFPPSARKKT